MDAATLARWQFGTVASLHFIFVALTMGLILLIAILETLAVRREEPVYEQAARYWGRLFMINFVLGIVTGIALEFQFGMNWSRFSAAAGDVIGLPLAIEAMAAFFIEAIALSVWHFGHGRISPRTRLASIWTATFGSFLSAFWVLAANSWMQHPVAYVVESGKIHLTSFVGLFLNPHLWRQFPHTALATVVTGAFFVMGVSAWHLLRKTDHREVFERSFRLALAVGLVSSTAVAFVGHEQAQYKAQTQPMKIAAIEALWESEEPASFSLFALIDEEGHSNRWEVEVPFALSILAYNKPSGEVRGIEELQKASEERYGPGDYVPPVEVTYWSFRVMVGIGLLLIALAGAGVWLWYRDALFDHPLYLKAMIAAIPLPYVANTAGWIVAEVGRQPWIVQGVMRTREGTSQLPVETVGTALVGFGALYLFLTTLDLWLMARAAREGPRPLPGQEEGAGGP